MININNVSPEAKKLLQDGLLLDTTEALALQTSNNYDFARRIVQEIALINGGQMIKHLNVGQLDRATSHAGLYAPPGLGKDFGWKIAASSGIFPSDALRMTKLENVTEAALSGSLNEITIVPPPTVTEDLIFVGEYATLNRGSQAASISADMRAILESGEYTRRMVKIGLLKEILHTKPDSPQANYIQEQLVSCAKLGMTIDLDKCQISIKSTTSWIVSSAKFGSETHYGRSLLSMGDINRYRWISYLPEREERLNITSQIGSLPPIIVDTERRKTCKEAWSILFKNMRNNSTGLVVPRDEQSYYSRQKVWEDTQKLSVDTYFMELTNEIYFNQLVNMRTRAEFTRLMYQHAVLKQFARNSGCDFGLPEKFVIDYDEDGEFAKEYWVNEYVPSMIDLISDVLSNSETQPRSSRVTLTSKITSTVVERLRKGPAKREELIAMLDSSGIKPYLLDTQVLPILLKYGIIKRTEFGIYALTEDADIRLKSLEKSKKPFVERITYRKD